MNPPPEREQCRAADVTQAEITEPVGHLGRLVHLLDMDGAIVTSVLDRDTASASELALAHLIEEHHGSMVRAAFVVCGDPALAREAAQNAWTIAWRRLPGLRDPDRARSWLVAIAANEARQLFRRDKRRRVLEIAAQPPGRTTGDPADAIDLLDLDRALSRLHVDDRRLLAMRYVTGLDSSLIATHLGMTASGVRSRLARAVERLRRELEGD
jgi:RNA polymerase sigma-70 factor (ECF subfamily)